MNDIILHGNNHTPPILCLKHTMILIELLIKFNFMNQTLYLVIK